MEMNALFLSLLLAAGGDDCCVEGQSKPWKLYNAGIRWQNPATASADRSDPLKLARSTPWDALLKSSLDRARTEKKLVLLFQLVGDLDLEGC